MLFVFFFFRMLQEEEITLSGVITFENLLFSTGIFILLLIFLFFFSLVFRIA